MNLNVVVPAYNEAECLARLLPALSIHLAALPAPVDSHEIIVVDDHSTDETFAVASAHPGVRVLRLSRRSGSHTALRAGLAVASGDAALCMAADGQDDPGVLKALLEEWTKGSHIVWALRKKRFEGRANDLFARFFYGVLKRTTPPQSSEIDLARADFFLLDRRVVDAVNAMPETRTSLFGMLVWLGFQSGSVEYERKARAAGVSKWSFVRKLGLAVDWLVSFSGLPIRAVTYAGLGLSVLGLVYLAAVLIGYGLGLVGVAGWTSIIAVLLILFGFQMFFTGVIGEYLWRNFQESKRRPLCFIEADSSEASNIKI